jgi:predicted permease
MRTDAMLQTVRDAWRSLRRTPLVSLAILLTLALGIGANAAVFSLVDAVIFKPLPVRAPHELIALYETAPGAELDVNGGRGRYFRFSYPRFERLRDALGSLGTLTAMTPPRTMSVALRERSTADVARVQLVEPAFLQTLGADVSDGRPLQASDLATGDGDAAALVSFAFAERTFGTAAAAIGRRLRIAAAAATIVGVTQQGFVGAWSDDETDIWIPLSLQQAVGYVSNASTAPGAGRTTPWMRDDRIAWLTLAARIPAGARARAEVALKTANQAGVAEFSQHFQDPGERRSASTHALATESLAQGFSRLRTPYTTVLYTLLSLVAIVLLVGCGNVANLLLARAAAAERDLHVRLALGASARRLVAQGLVESLLLALAGAIGGFVIGTWAGHSIARLLLSGNTAVPQVFAADVRVAAFTALLATLTAVTAGVHPIVRAVRAARSQLQLSRERQLSTATAAGMRPLVACQIALAFVGVLAAVLLGRTLVNYLRIDPGFRVDRVVNVTLNVEPAVATSPRAVPSGDTLVSAAMAVPGVVSASASQCSVLGNCADSSGLRFDNGRRGVLLNENWISPDYFRTLGIPLVAGRAFTRTDTASSPRVAVVSESVARTQFPGGAIGHRLGVDQPDTEIVGIVKDARSLTLHDEPLPMVYFPITQPAQFVLGPSNIDVLVTGDPVASTATIREAIRRAAPGLPIVSAAPLQDRVERDLARETVAAYLAAAFSGLTLLLAAIGLHGVLSFIVTRRTPEIGVRLAVGATRRHVVRLVLGDGLSMLGTGILVGGAAAAAIERTITALLFGVQPHDAVAYLAVAAMLLAVTLLASLAPAHRATRVDPVVSLKST